MIVQIVSMASSRNAVRETDQFRRRFSESFFVGKLSCSCSPSFPPSVSKTKPVAVSVRFPVFLLSLRRTGFPAGDSSAGRVLASDISISHGSRGSVGDDLVVRAREGSAASVVGGSSASVLRGVMTG